MPALLRPLSVTAFADQARQLIEAAREVRMRAYAPYSGYLVGAAVLTAGPGAKIYVGVNVEAVDFDVTHAEESAFSAMQAAGVGTWLPDMIVAVGAPKNIGRYDAPIVTPCGKCRQKIYEWVRNTRDRDIDVIVADPATGQPMLCSIRELLPLSFG